MQTAVYVRCSHGRGAGSRIMGDAKTGPYASPRTRKSRHPSSGAWGAKYSSRSSIATPRGYAAANPSSGAELAHEAGEVDVLPDLGDPVALDPAERRLGERDRCAARLDLAERRSRV